MGGGRGFAGRDGTDSAATGTKVEARRGNSPGVVAALGRNPALLPGIGGTGRLEDLAAVWVLAGGGSGRGAGSRGGLRSTSAGGRGVGPASPGAGRAVDLRSGNAWTGRFRSWASARVFGGGGSGSGVGSRGGLRSPSTGGRGVGPASPGASRAADLRSGSAWMGWFRSWASARVFGGGGGGGGVGSRGGLCSQASAGDLGAGPVVSGAGMGGDLRSGIAGTGWFRNRASAWVRGGDGSCLGAAFGGPSGRGSGREARRAALPPSGGSANSNRASTRPSSVRSTADSPLGGRKNSQRTGPCSANRCSRMEGPSRMSSVASGTSPSTTARLPTGCQDQTVAGRAGVDAGAEGAPAEGGSLR
jgi:hypothetical protein